MFLPLVDLFGRRPPASGMPILRPGRLAPRLGRRLSVGRFHAGRRGGRVAPGNRSRLFGQHLSQLQQREHSRLLRLGERVALACSSVNVGPMGALSFVITMASLPVTASHRHIRIANFFQDQLHTAKVLLNLDFELAWTLQARNRRWRRIGNETSIAPATSFDAPHFLTAAFRCQLFDRPGLTF